MAQIWPANDDFTEGATHYGASVCGYLRIQPWTTDSGSGDAIVAAADGAIHSGYFTVEGTLGGQPVVNVGSPARKVAVRNGSGSANAIGCYAWRPAYIVNAEAKAGFHWQPYGSAPLGIAGWRYGLVGVRIAGGFLDNTTGSERNWNPDGYWLVMRNAGTATTAKFMLLRVNGGTVTKLTESALVDVSAILAHSSVWISLRALTSGATVVLRCRRGPIGTEAVDGTSTVDVFGADVVDSSGSRITAAGRCAFGMAKPIAGGASLCSSFQIKNEDTGDVVFRDEWDRATYVGAQTTATDANGVRGQYMMPWYGSSVGGNSAGVGYAVRDVGNDRISNALVSTASNAYRLNMNSLARASHAAVQYRSLKITWATPSGRTDNVQIEIRGRDLHQPTGPNARFYRLEIELANGTAWTLRIVAVNGGVATTLATKTVAIGVTTHTFALRATNVGGATPMEGDPWLVPYLNGGALTGWTLAGVPGVEQLLGAIIDRRSTAIVTGWEQGWRYVSTPQTGTNADIRFDDWEDLAVIPTTPDDDLAGAAIAGEAAGATGTLTVPVSWRVEVSHRRPAVLHRYESDHLQALALGSRERRRWAIDTQVAKPADVDALEAFFDSHRGCEIPFSWATDEGDTATVRFVTPDLPRRIRDARVHGFSFELEELFA